MFNRNAAAPWFYAAGSAVLGFVGFQVFRRLTRARRVGVADAAREQPAAAMAPQRTDQTAPERHSRTRTRNVLGPTLLGDELEAPVGRATLVPGDAYDAVAPDDLAPEWLSRATESSLAANNDESIDPEVADLLREAGMSLVSEGSLNWASPVELERAVRADLEGTEDQFDLEFDDSSLRVAAR